MVKVCPGLRAYFPVPQSALGAGTILLRSWSFCLVVSGPMVSGPADGTGRPPARLAARIVELLSLRHGLAIPANAAVAFVVPGSFSVHVRFTHRRNLGGRAPSTCVVGMLRPPRVPSGVAGFRACTARLCSERLTLHVSAETP